MELLNVLPQELCELIETKKHNLATGENNKLLLKLFKNGENDYEDVLFGDEFEDHALSIQTEKSWSLYKMIIGVDDNYNKLYRSHLGLGCIKDQ